MDINTELWLNLHHREVQNMSLVDALNIQLAKDESCITNEDGIIENTYIKNYLTSYFQSNYDIVGIIPCNNELVIIAVSTNDNTNASIFRYKEKTVNSSQDIYCAYSNFKYHGGDIKGTFTYNVENSLIVAIAEYNVENTNIPLRTINLGNFNNNNIENDTKLPNNLLSISPEVKIPKVTNLKYIKGNAYKGWYYIFIRFKINTVDYTQWYPIGFPIYVDTLNTYQIIRYCYEQNKGTSSSGPTEELWNIVYPSKPDDGYGVGCSDNISDNTDIATETFNISIDFNNDKYYNKYQIGLIVSSKTYTKAFRTEDINKKENITNYIFESKNVVEYSATELITDNINFFNVKNIINYKNRLYISNYIENNVNDKNITGDIQLSNGSTYNINNIVVNLKSTTIKDYGLCNNKFLLTKNNKTVKQYDYFHDTAINAPYLRMQDVLGVSDDTIITVTSSDIESETVKDKAKYFYIATFVCNEQEVIDPETPSKLQCSAQKENIIPGFAYVIYNNGEEIKEIGKKSTDYSSSFIVYIDGKTASESFKFDNVAVNGNMIYINTSRSFETRKLNSTLLPGEIYNFYIHYVDKYGHCTNGYKIENNNKWHTEDDEETEIIPIPFIITEDIQNSQIFAALPIDTKLLFGGALNIANIKFYNNYNGYNLTNKITDTTTINNYTEQFKTYFNSFETDKYSDFYWYQIANNVFEDLFTVFINNNNDRLFKTPIFSNYEKKGADPRYNLIKILQVNFENIIIPNDYIGYFISYEKFEQQQRVTGFLTRNDFKTQVNIGPEDNMKFNDNANIHNSNKMMFYSSEYDIADSIKLDYDVIRLDGKNIFKQDDVYPWDYVQRNNSFTYPYDCNKPQITKDGNTLFQIFAMPNYKLAVANSAKDNREGLGTALEIDNNYNLFTNFSEDTETVSNPYDINVYKVTLLNVSRNIYMNNNKTLIRLTDIYYKEEDDVDYTIFSTGYITNGYNGHATYDGVLVYNSDGVIFNTETNSATRLVRNGKEEEYFPKKVDNNTHTYDNNYPFVAYVQYPIYSDIFHESKSFKNEPAGIIFKVNTDNDNENYFYSGCMVNPIDTIDLFENKQVSSDELCPKTYTNYKKDLVSIQQFNKTIYRSNVIQDESKSNAWRIFTNDNYKFISENKGIITNLIGIGYYLIVHTEHSMFLFDANNLLQTSDQNVQLNQPDIFELAYKEVFTSDLGFGGLQDSKSNIIGSFGYIYYNNDFNHIYQFDNGQLILIDNSIIEWLNRYKPYNVRFADDKNNDRLLIKFDYYINGINETAVLSYNYKSKQFISFHSYYFDEAYNTKANLYLKCNNNHVNCSLHQFTKEKSFKCKYDNIKDIVGKQTIKESKISIIINEQYDIVKYLEFISYKLSKLAESYSTYLPVEVMVTPYSGDYIRVYNDNTDTGTVNISVNTEDQKNVFGNFKKPYWDLGNWNYSYLRNNIENTNIPASDMSRIFGNYFIIEFTFLNNDGKPIEFYNVSYNIVK